MLILSHPCAWNGPQPVNLTAESSRTKSSIRATRRKAFKDQGCISEDQSGGVKRRLWIMDPIGKAHSASSICCLYHCVMLLVHSNARLSVTNGWQRSTRRALAGYQDHSGTRRPFLERSLVCFPPTWLNYDRMCLIFLLPWSLQVGQDRGRRAYRRRRLLPLWPACLEMSWF